MSSRIVPEQHRIDKAEIQTGPVYHCPDCDQPVTFYQPNHFGPPPPWLEPWAAHVAYLRGPRACHQARHRARVAKLGAAIIPVSWPKHTGTDAHIQVIREALTLLATEHGPDGASFDPAATLVYGLLAGVVSPQAAIDEIRALVDDATRTAMIGDPGDAIVALLGEEL